MKEKGLEIPKGWNDIESVPDSQRDVEIMDEFGNIGIGVPTYYPFTVEKGKIKPCAEYHDGGWIILCDLGLDSSITGELKCWRELKDAD